MQRKLVPFLSLLLLLSLAACSEPAASTATPMPEGGLKRAGLSPSEVALLIEQEDTTPALEVISARAFRHLGEAVHIVGEAENTTDQALGNITIKVIGYGKGDRVMDEKEDAGYLDVVPPGTTVPFRVFFDARDVQRAEIIVTGEPTAAEPAESLPITDVAMSDVAQGYTHVTGKVTVPADGSKINLQAVLRDADGSVVEVHRGSPVKPLVAGVNGFDLLVLHHGATSVTVVGFMR